MAPSWLSFCVNLVAPVGSDATYGVSSMNARRYYHYASVGDIGDVQPVAAQASTASSPGAAFNNETSHIYERVAHLRSRSKPEWQMGNTAIKLSPADQHVLRAYSDTGRGRHFVNHTMQRGELKSTGELQMTYQPHNSRFQGATRTMLEAEVKATGEMQLSFQPRSSRFQSVPQAMGQTEINSQVVQDATAQSAIRGAYKDWSKTKNALARSLVRRVSPPVTEPVHSNGKATGYDPRHILDSASTAPAVKGIKAVDLSTLASSDEVPGPVVANILGTMTPHKKMWLIAFVVLSTAGVASVYFAARLQSRAAFVPNTHNSANALATTNGERKDGMSAKASESRQENNGEPATSSASASCLARGQCRGFESSQAWRDPTIDLQIGDRSLEGWMQRRRSEALVRLGGCAVLTAVLLLLQIVVGIYIGSLALMSNGVHLITDVAMYVGLFLVVHSSSAASVDPSYRSSYSYGLHRLEVVFVLIALTIQYVTILHIVATAARRIWHPVEIASEGGVAICAAAILSLCVNSCLAVWISWTSHGHSHSHAHGGTATYMARLHLIFDAVENGIVIVAGALIWIDPHLKIVDPLCSFLFAFLVVISSQSFFRQLLHIVLERTPEGLDCDQILKNLEDMTHVLNVHCLHVWSISHGKPAMSVHLHVSNGTHHEVLQEVKTVLKHRYGIHHSTIEIWDDDDLS